MRVIDILRFKYPDGEWSWDREHRIWSDSKTSRWVRGESILKRCCMDPCDHARVGYRLHAEFYGPIKPEDELRYHPDYSEAIYIYPHANLRGLWQ